VTNKNQKTIFFAHRGAWKLSLENTIESFKLAVKNNFFHLETDLRCSADGKIILSHDPSFKRLGGPEDLITNLSAQAIKEINLKNNFKPCFLDDIYPLFSKCKWIWDIKPEDGIKTIKCLEKWAKENQAQKWIIENVWFLLWDKKQEKLLEETFPKATCLAQENSCWRAGLSALLKIPALGNIQKNKKYGLPPRLFGINLYREKIISSYTNRGAQIIAYLPQTNDEIKLAQQSGINIFLIDYDKIS
jgi:glycerophosphoryl diester phosphodiesterase